MILLEIKVCKFSPRYFGRHFSISSFPLHYYWFNITKNTTIQIPEFHLRHDSMGSSIVPLSSQRGACLGFSLPLSLPLPCAQMRVHTRALFSHTK